MVQTRVNGEKASYSRGDQEHCSDTDRQQDDDESFVSCGQHLSIRHTERLDRVIDEILRQVVALGDRARWYHLMVVGHECRRRETDAFRRRRTSTPTTLATPRSRARFESVITKARASR